MSTEKKIRLVVDDKKLKDLRQSTQELANDMIRSSRNYTTSSKEILKDLESQIKLIEKRNSLEEKSKQIKLHSQLDSGNINKSQFRESVSQLKLENKTDSLQISILREIIETIKQTSQKEIKEDREGVSRVIRKSKTVDKLGVARRMTPEKSLIEVLQKDYLGDLGKEETENRQNFRNYGKFGKAQNIVNTGAQLATSKNAFYAASAVIALTPFVGQALKGVSDKLLSSAENAGHSKENFAQLHRMGMNGHYDSNNKWHPGVNDIDVISTYRGIGKGFGFTGSEAINEQIKLEKISKSHINLASILGAESNLGLKNELPSIFSSTRHHTNNGGDAFTGISNLNKVISATGQMQSALPEILTTFNQIANQISQHGFVDIDSLSRHLGGVSEVSGLKGQHLTNFANQIQGLAGGGSNPVIRSMMIGSFMKEHPEKSFWDISTMMETPWKHTKELSSMFKGIEDNSSGDMRKWILKSTLNASGQDIETDLAGGASISDILLAKSSKANRDRQLGTGGSSKISEMTRSTKKFGAAFEDWGDAAVVFTDKLFEGLGSKMKMLMGDETELQQSQAQQSKMMREAVAQGIRDGMKKH